MITTFISAAQNASEVVAPTSSQIFISEFLGSAILILIGCGGCANANLSKAKGKNGGWLLICFGWALAVWAGVYVAYRTGGHLNPAVTLGKALGHCFDNTVTLAPGVAVTVGNIVLYIVAQFLGCFVGAVMMWLAYKKHFDQVDNEPALILGSFSNAPAIRSYPWNVVTEAIATMVLVLWIFISGGTDGNPALTAVGVMFILLGIGIGLGGPTGYALNPARDFAPRIAHAVLPIKTKGSNDWEYSWVPVVGPIIGGLVGAVIAFGFGVAA